MGGALERQLPVPDSHFLPLGVCEPVVVGVVLPVEGAEPAADLSGDAFRRTLLPLGVVLVVLAVVLAVLASVVMGAGGGACVSGLDFLRRFMPAGSGDDESRLKGLCADCQRRLDMWTEETMECLPSSRGWARHAQA